MDWSLALCMPRCPPRVEYDLTAMGRTLIEPAVALAMWAVTHQPETAAARRAFDEQ
ncbi:winged helix-turn-helix transcriptional regulator [Streptomyces avermitilis]|uniref:winged helix-turn-helix transcriptional regulator n=1 Tax=Streptomyces avermitilis TaxID=33903 RepID=UPI0033DF87F1